MSEKMFVRMFQPRFAKLVEQGRKLQTVRLTPKRMPKPGDRISLRCWAGKPYRSKQRVLSEARITGVQKVQIAGTDWRKAISIDQVVLDYTDALMFAVKDGFRNVTEMMKWFEENHGLPFEGIVIRWEGLVAEGAEKRKVAEVTITREPEIRRCRECGAPDPEDDAICGECREARLYE